MIKNEKEFGKNLAKVRHSKHLSQEKLAELTGLHRTYISDIERGQRNPTIKIVIELCRALNIESNELFHKGLL